MFSKHKWPTFSGILMIVIVIISIFSFAFLTADNKLFSSDNLITGNMVKVTGMASKTYGSICSQKEAITNKNG